VAIAAELLARAPERYGFYIIGDGPLRDEVRGVIEAHKAGSGVRMLGFHENPLPVLRCMDCLLVTSDHEGLPTNVLEAMCLKVTVVSRNLPGIAGALGQGAYGELVDGDEPAAYADAIERAFDGAGPARDKADRAYEHVRRHYGHDMMADRYLGVYRQLLASR
jgi:glycosyltransferase involved in cell wall biosynthesis